MANSDQVFQLRVFRFGCRLVQNGKLGAENLGKVFFEVSEISENFEFSTSPCRSRLSVFSVLLALLNSKALNQGTVSDVKTHLSIRGKSTSCSSNSIYTTNSYSSDNKLSKALACRIFQALHPPHPRQRVKAKWNSDFRFGGKSAPLQIKLLTQLQKAFCFLLFWILSRLFP